MEALRQPAISQEAGDGEIVKLKQLPAATRDVLTCRRVTGTGGGVGEKTRTEPVLSSADGCSDGIGRQGEAVESENRDSVSSSEGIGVNPEDCSTDVITDAFAAAELSDAACKGSGEEPQRTGQGNSTDLDLGSADQDDKIVGLEVNASGAETTVNLLHLLRRKNRSAEEISTEYRNHELWVIGEEGGGETEDESDFSEGESESEGTGPSVSVPQLFIVDENDAVVERVRTGRRRSSTKDCSASGGNATQLNSSLTSSACSLTSRPSA